MNLLFIVFRNRTSTMMFFDILKRNRIYGRIVSTPKKITSSCGLSVETNISNLNIILKIIKQGNFNSLVGIYKSNVNDSFFDKIY